MLARNFEGGNGSKLSIDVAVRESEFCRKAPWMFGVICIILCPEKERKNEGYS